MASFANELEVTSIEKGCIVTLPLKTADDRFIDVFVEPVTGSLFTYVHDGGKSTAELHAQGIHATDTQESILKGIARSHGAQFQDGRFQIACANEKAVQTAIYSIAQCASLAMIDVVSHVPKIEDESLMTRVARSLQQWCPDYVDIERRHYVKGKLGMEHLIDFASFVRRRSGRNVAIKILPPSVGPMWQAQRFGFLIYDTQGTAFDDWRKLAIIAKADEWTNNALGLVRSLADSVITLESDREEAVELSLPARMTELSEVA